MIGGVRARTYIYTHIHTHVHTKYIKMYFQYIYSRRHKYSNILLHWEFYTILSFNITHKVKIITIRCIRMCKTKNRIIFDLLILYYFKQDFYFNVYPQFCDICLRVYSKRKRRRQSWSSELVDQFRCTRWESIPAKMRNLHLVGEKKERKLRTRVRDFDPDKKLFASPELCGCVTSRKRKMERSLSFIHSLSLSLFAEASIFGKLRRIGKWSISFSKLSKLSFCRRAGGFKCDHCLRMTLGNERRSEDRLRQGSRVITKVVDAGSSFPPSNLQRTLSRLSASFPFLSSLLPYSRQGLGNGSWIRESETKRGASIRGNPVGECDVVWSLPVTLTIKVIGIFRGDANARSSTWRPYKRGGKGGGLQRYDGLKAILYR